jgi:hypothetical protein
MRSRILGVVAIAAAMLFSAPVQAQPIQFFFANSSGVFQNSFTIPAVGGTVDIQVFINDTGAASSFFTGPNPSAPTTTQLSPTQTQNLNTYNLRGGTFRTISGTPSVAHVVADTDITPNSAFSFVPVRTANSGNGNADLGVFALGGPGVSANGTGRIFLGTFHFTAFANGTTALSFADNDGLNQGTALGSEPTSPFPPVSNGGAILDPTGPNPNPPPPTIQLPPIPGLFSNTATIIVGVPEPTSLILGGVGLAGLGFIRRRTSKVAV